MSEKIDKLNRGEFINFIKNLIINSEQYKRNNDSESYVIALDSAWGTGKSYFIDLLIQNIESDESIKFVKYNAWKNDYCDNAFNPLFYDILNSDCLKFSTEQDADKENFKNLLLNIVQIGAAFGKQTLNEAIKNKTGIDLENAINEAFNTTKDIKDFMLREIPDLAELNLQRSSFDSFKEYLYNATEWLKDNDKKLVVIIDELDRCKPTFAIQTLEIIKHIFDVKNIVFLFALDIEQLSHSISSIYGRDFDSVGYLCRFFDYIAKMPSQDIRLYINEQINNINSIANVKVLSFNKNHQYSLLSEAISDFVFDIYCGFEFSLRDLDTVLQSYKIMLNHFLGEYQMLGAHMIYIFYLALKYKKPEMFYKTFIDNSSYKTFIQSELRNFASKIFNNNKWIMATIKTMIDDNTLCETTFLPACDGNAESSYSSWLHIETIQENYIIFINKNNYEHTIARQSKQVINTIDQSTGNILFYPDINKWNDIKNMTYRQYIHKRLEMYNFTDINTKAKNS